MDILNEKQKKQIKQRQKEDAGFCHMFERKGIYARPRHNRTLPEERPKEEVLHREDIPLSRKPYTL